MDDLSELDGSWGALRERLAEARLFIGGIGAGGLKLLACSWFAIGLGTLSLLPNAGGAQPSVRIAAERHTDTTARTPAQLSADLVAVSQQRSNRLRRPPHATPAKPAAGVATLDTTVSPRPDGGGGESDTASASAPASQAPTSTTQAPPETAPDTSPPPALPDPTETVTVPTPALPLPEVSVPPTPSLPQVPSTDVDLP